MYYVMITIQKMRYLLSEKEKNAVFDDIQDGKPCTVVQGEMIPLQAPPTIVSFPRWWAAENERLAVSGKRLCKKCLKVMDAAGSCVCWKQNGGEKQDAFVAVPEEILKIVHAGAKSFPELTDEDKFQIEVEQFDVNKTPQLVSQNGMMGYINPETGEEMFD